MAAFPTAETQAALLLCGRLGQRDDLLKPLTARQYSALVKLLRQRSLRPADLLQPVGRKQLADIELGEVSCETIERLLDRGAALGLVVERWISQGLWIVGQEDNAYPTRYEDYLRNTAPPVLFGAGEQALLQRGGLAIAGSRRAADEDLEFSDRVGAACAAQKLVVISGAAKGVDSSAMMAAVRERGYAVGVLAEGLGRTTIAGSYHDAILDGHLTLISPYEPESRWFPYTAMERNKLIYALADAALIVSASDGEGGTWAGAVEALKRGRIPVYVKAPNAAPGNLKLLHAGAREFPAEPWDDLSGLFDKDARVSPLFDSSDGIALTSEASADSAAAPVGDSVTPVEVKPNAPKQVSATCSPDQTWESEEQESAADSNEKALEVILAILEQPLGLKAIQDALKAQLGVRPKQASSFLKQAIADRKVQKTKPPVRYERASAKTRLEADAALTLFPDEAEICASSREKASPKP